jgi:hypothetical protein
MSFYDINNQMLIVVATNSQKNIGNIHDEEMKVIHDNIV